MGLVEKMAMLGVLEGVVESNRSDGVTVLKDLKNCEVMDQWREQLP